MAPQEILQIGLNWNNYSQHSSKWNKRHGAKANSATQQHRLAVKMTFKSWGLEENIIKWWINWIEQYQSWLSPEGFITRHLSGQPIDHCSPHPAWHPHRGHCYEGHLTEKKWKGFCCRKFRLKSWTCCIMLPWMTYAIQLAQCNVASAAPTWTRWMRRLGATPSVLCQKVRPSWMAASWEGAHIQEGQVQVRVRLCLHEWEGFFVENNKNVYVV